MIVYAGKQFWNDFNNGDEALFEDAGLPRDSNKFKILPWINTRKNDYRTANSWIAAQGLFQWLKIKEWNSSAYAFSVANMKNSYTPADFAEVNWFVASDGTTYNADTLSKGIKSTIIWRPYVNADGDIIIWKSGLYAVTCQCVFIAPTWYSASNSYNYKFYVYLVLNWQMDMWTQGRWCWTIDAYSLFFMGRFNTWDRINTWFTHTYETKAFLCQPSINLYRLS